MRMTLKQVKHFWVLPFFFSLLISAPIATGADLAVIKHTCHWTFDLLRIVSGGHHLYNIPLPEVDIPKALPERLIEFAAYPNTTKTWIKKNIRFNPVLVSTVRRILTSRSENLDLVSSLSSIQVGEEFNYVIYAPQNGQPGGIMLGRIKIKWDRFDDLLSKHLLLAGYGADVRYGGSAKMGEGKVIHFKNDSGTFQPKQEYIQTAEEILNSAFAHTGYTFIGTPVDIAKIKAEAEALKNQSLQ